MSVAIIPMAQQFGWSPSVAGIVQSSFFYGYMASQLPSGYLANRFSGRWVLPGGVGTWSLFTAAVPLFSASIPTLCVSRAAVGLGEGVAPSAINDIVVNSVPKNERARAISTIFGGLHIGSIAGLLLAPPLIAHFGWQAVFYVFGALGLVWIAGFEGVVRGKGKEMEALRNAMRSEEATTGHSTGVPFRAFVRNGPVRALMFTHFANNWFHYTMLAWLPTYFTQTLSLGIRDASMVALLPSIAGVIVSSVSGQLADGLIESGMAVRRVRTLAQSTAFLLPAVCLCFAGFFEGQQLAIAFISAALGLNSFALSGLYCTHGDMSTKYAGPLLGLTNTSGAVPGIIGVAVVGILYDMTRSWALALFAPICVFFVLGTVVYATAASSEPQDFGDDSPFAVEDHITNFWCQLGGKQQ
jgi:MFS transporter, ACS family, solute carrier family 17 (sodium-dependent inorganic phosphate cotransporter), other